MKEKITKRLLNRLEPSDRPYDVRDTDLTGFLLRVRPSGSINYYFEYRRTDGRKTRIRIGQTSALSVAQARDMALQYAAQAARGEDIQATKQHLRDQARLAQVTTLGGFLTHQYAPWLCAERPERRRSVEELQRLQTNFASMLEHPLASISPWEIEKWRAEQRKRSKTPAAINRDLATLKSVLSKAVTWGVIDEHPLTSLKPLKVDKQARIRYLTDEEEQRLRAFLAQRDRHINAKRERGNTWRRTLDSADLLQIRNSLYGDHITPMVLLTLNTGLRRGELFHLRWRDIDDHVATLTVEGRTAKSGQTRHIPLNDEARTVLSAWRAQQDNDDLVFPGKTGAPLTNVKKAWAGVVRRAQLANFRWHDLRHDFASKLVMAGVPLNTVRELLGHVNLTTTLRYAHLAPDHKAEAVNRLRRPSAISRSAEVQTSPAP